MPPAHQLVRATLPAIRGSAPGPYYAIGFSGHSTSIARAPKTIISFPANTFDTCFQSPALQYALNVVNDNEIATEASHNLLTEGDIERASALYLLHVVNIIIERGLFPTIGHPVTQLECVGQSTTGTSRPDIKYAVNGKTILILEYKRTNTLRDDDWTKDALVSNTRTAQQIINNIPPGVQTALLDNAAIASKQASKYSGQCGVVVLFDYQHMIVLDYTTGPGNTLWNDLNYPVNYHFSSGTGILPEKTFRELFLAVFVYSMRKAGLMGNND